ncbi:MAG: CRTAC1 family protein [Deltaproteobacteria bacterium]|nr:CRTAC1 family protein [Deltaproteobacteria bacterium]
MRWTLSAVLVMTACSAPPEPPPASLFDEEPSTEATATTLQTDGVLEFEDVATASGLTWSHHGGRNAAKWLPETMGGGVALLDANRDGAVDVLVVESGSLVGARSPDGGTRLYLGDGRGSFEDVTAAWGLTTEGFGMGVAAGDIDGDGWTDVYLTSFAGGDRLLRNDGGTRFVDVTASWGIAPEGWSTSAAFLDMDGDGDLDLYVTRYIDYSLTSALKCWFRKTHIYCTPALYDASPDRLYRNDGNTFTDVSEASGIASHRAKGLALSTGDLDKDGDVDIYVANDISRNLMLMNDGAGQFEEEGLLAGVAYSELGREEASMGVSITDANADGHWDLAVTNFQAEPTGLYMGRGQAQFREQSDRLGIGATSRARLSFGIEFFDADNDGDDELVTANGHITDNVADYKDGVVSDQLNSLYLNDGGQFTDVSAESGTAFATRGVSRGLATGDLDSDGGVDLVIVNNEGPLVVAANRTKERGHWLSLWLEGVTSNRSAIGAVVTARIGEAVLVREVRGGSSYLAVSDRRVHLGLGDATNASLSVRWPDGSEQEFEGVASDRHLRLVQGGELVPYTPGKEQIAP